MKTTHLISELAKIIHQFGDLDVCHLDEERQKASGFKINVVHTTEGNGIIMFCKAGKEQDVNLGGPRIIKP